MTTPNAASAHDACANLDYCRDPWLREALGLPPLLTVDEAAQALTDMATRLAQMPAQPARFDDDALARVQAKESNRE